MQRRAFLTSLAASTLPLRGWAAAGNPAYLAAAKEPDGGYALFGLDGQGGDLFRIPLPGRGHAATAHPHVPEAVAFARRPGNFALVIDCATGRVAQRLTAPKGRHFYGHGTFVFGGDLLVTTENHIATGQGLLGLWARDRHGYRRIGERPTHGIGPHDVLALPGDILAVANGGIRTDPAQGRAKLNLDSMAPNLAYIQPDQGLIERISLDPALRHNSIRHLASDGTTVAFAMQWQGDPADPVPLLGLHRRGQNLILAEADLPEQFAMKGYAGSVAVSGGQVAITSPRGGRLHRFDLQGKFLSSLRRADICGLAARDDGFLASDGLGGVLALDGPQLSPLVAAPRAWDNHMIRVGPPPILSQ